MNNPENTHRELIERAKKGERKAQKELYMTYVEAMYNVCLRMVRNQHDAEDLVQEAFAKAFLSLKGFAFRSSFGAWLKRIVVNESINFLKSKRVEEVEWMDVKEEALTDTSRSPELTMESIKLALDYLSEGYRSVLNLYLFEGYDHVEISDIVGISVSTSKSQYMRGKKQLLSVIKAKPWMN